MEVKIWKIRDMDQYIAKWEQKSYSYHLTFKFHKQQEETSREWALRLEGMIQAKKKKFDCET